MLSEKPILCPQGCEGNYMFAGENLMVFVTPGFLDAFGSEAKLLAFASQCLILETYTNPDWLQIFTYKGIKYYCIADFERGDKVDDYKEVERFYITFLLPHER